MAPSTRAASSHHSQEGAPSSSLLVLSAPVVSPPVDSSPGPEAGSDVGCSDRSEGDGVALLDSGRSVGVLLGRGSVVSSEACELSGAVGSPVSELVGLGRSPVGGGVGAEQ